MPFRIILPHNNIVSLPFLECHHRGSWPPLHHRGSQQRARRAGWSPSLSRQPPEDQEGVTRSSHPYLARSSGSLAAINSAGVLEMLSHEGKDLGGIIGIGKVTEKPGNLLRSLRFPLCRPVPTWQPEQTPFFAAQGQGQVSQDLNHTQISTLA